MDNEVHTTEPAPLGRVILDTLIFSVFVPIVAGIIGCVAVLNAIDANTQAKIFPAE